MHRLFPTANSSASRLSASMQRPLQSSSVHRAAAAATSAAGSSAWKNYGRAPQLSSATVAFSRSFVASLPLARTHTPSQSSPSPLIHTSCPNPYFHVLSKNNAAVSPSTSTSAFPTATTTVLGAAAVGGLAETGELTSFSGALDGSSIFHYFAFAAQDLLIGVHNLTGLPWWQSIVIATLGIRLALLPLAVFQQKNLVGMAVMKPELQAMSERHKATNAKYSVAGMATPMDVRMAHSVEAKALFKKYKTGPFRGLATPLVLMPVFMSMFFGLRTLGHVDPTFMQEGAAWFPNLAQLDPGFHDLVLNAGLFQITVGLPMINTGLMFLTIYCNSEFAQQSNSAVGKVMKKVMYGLTAMSLPFCSTSMPSGVLLYWCVSNVWAIFQGFFIRSAIGKKLFGIGDMPDQTGSMDRDYEQLKKVFGAKMSNPEPASKAQAAQPLNPFEVPRAASVQQQQQQANSKPAQHTGANEYETEVMSPQASQEFYRRKNAQKRRT